MKCQELFESLEGYQAGALPRAQAEAVEQHLLACDDCRADFTFQRKLRSDLAGLPRDVVPPGRVWQGVESRIGRLGTRPSGVLTWWQRKTALAAAAVVLIALTAAVTALLVRQPGGTETRGEFQATAAAYERTAIELSRALELRRNELSPAALAVVEHNLHIIDEAIRETQAALADDPRNQRVAELLWASWEKKIDLLERAAEHADS